MPDNRPPVQIEWIALQNFRSIEDATLTFTEPFTLILGDNGAGKTTVIEALRIGIAAFLSGIKAVRGPNMQNKDIRESIYPDDLGSVDLPPELRLYEPATILARGRFQSTTVTWSLQKTAGSTMSGKIKEITEVARLLAEDRSAHLSVILPVLAYYPAHRVAPIRTDPIERTLPPGRWERGYEGAFDASLRQDKQLGWLRSLTLSSLQQDMPSPILDAVLAGVAECLEGYRRIYYSVQLEELVAVDNSGKQHRAQMLSEGYWTTLMLILDIAYRASLLNPHLGINLLNETPGIILIDELDLHLHPRWQQRIVSDLQRVFPQIQFIATTHSPLIGASLPSSSLYHMESDDNGWSTPRKFSEQSLGLSPDQMLSSPYFDLESDRPVQADEHLEELTERIGLGDTDAALEFLRRLNGGMEATSSG